MGDESKQAGARPRILVEENGWRAGISVDGQPVIEEIRGRTLDGSPRWIVPASDALAPASVAWRLLEELVAAEREIDAFRGRIERLLEAQKAKGKDSDR